MAPSPFRNELLEAKNRLENKVEDFERQLREMAERMNQSIEQLSIDCELKCSRVWREFNAFMKETQLKAEELCDDMRRKTSEQQIKWRFSLREKEDLLKEAGMWHNDLLHLLSAGNDNKDVVFGLHSVEAKLSSRLQESFDPVEGGHFVVTFPEWCQRSLNQLQKEIVDFTVGTWPTRSLELQSECYLPCSDMGISMITSSDKDGRLFAVDDGDGTVKEFTEFGRVVSRCSIENEEENFAPFDICRLSNDTLPFFSLFIPPSSPSYFPSLLIERKSPPSMKCLMTSQRFPAQFILRETTRRK
ncbi:unnamed protein product [Acanthosepion pharaonis]|uniref:Uncharacterized protein n=1 Tax=Acanthosepion pharaonis TaxID=158019 RepID=A0A812DHX8_ACAPH|nr:unnamed protein product [Sepia pharaonis]